MAQLIFNIPDFDLSSTWVLQYDKLNEETGFYEADLLISQSASDIKTVSITGIPEGENVQKAVLSATINLVGDVGNTEIIKVNNLNFSRGRKTLPVEEFANDTEWTAEFYFQGAYGGGGVSSVPNAIENKTCTAYFTNVVLTLTTGAGAVFSGEIGSLVEGTKIFVKESNETTGVYSIVQHGYGDSTLCLLWRDTCLDASVAFNQNENSYLKGNYGTLDEYLDDTFYNSLPDETKAQIQLGFYPTLTQASYGSVISLERYISTPSVIELFENVGYDERHENSLDYLNTVNNGETYWTRSINPDSLGNAYIINSSGEPTLYNRELSLPARPCFCVLETQLVVPTEDGLGYTLSGVMVEAPTEIYLNGSSEDLTDLQRDVILTLSWNAVQDSRIQGYEVWISDSVDGEYSFYRATQIDEEGNIPTSIEITSGSKGYAEKYLKVRAITTPETEYLDSSLSLVARSYSTKKTGVHYYDGAFWRLAVPNYYNGIEKKTVNSIMYYDNK